MFNNSIVKGLLVTGKLLSALDGIPGLESVKIINFSCSALKGVIMTWHNKVSFSWILHKGFAKLHNFGVLKLRVENNPLSENFSTFIFHIFFL